MTEGAGRRLAVLGSPVEHSKSPALHQAAYRVLRLSWEYGRAEVKSGGLETFLASINASWRGLSLTMPLKREVLPLLTERSETVELVGVANTVLLDGGHRRGFNTDVGGMVTALADHDVYRTKTGHIIGTGATAASALVALAWMGASRILISGRHADGVPELDRLADRVGVRTVWRCYGDPVGELPGVVINTLPGGIDPADVLEADGGGILLEVPYDPWPTRRVARWRDRDAVVVSGLEMLVHQAVAQVKIFVTGEEGGHLAAEEEILAAMREAVGLRVGG